MAYIHKFFIQNIFDFRNVLMFTKDNCVVCVQIRMSIDKPCGTSFMYSKNKKGLSIDLWETLQFMAPAFEKNSAQ